ncbi:hypothetical protein JKG47_15785 [Acidithiobacillus sp. MC6.1]|nr:hypothetical protein [Acidithiobacillus sp. MC6.1]
MTYPTLEQYNEAFQNPQLALTDPVLKHGMVSTTGLGLPLALCGGFALTYTINTSQGKCAVRCFHKQSNNLEMRYISILRRLKSLQSTHFVDFDFQPQGIRVAGKYFPIVKMAWASGTTLGEFLEQNYRNSSNLLNVRSSLHNLAKYLESQKIAHGDIQPGNIMVADYGRRIQLIDYDGIFIEELRATGSSELGHRNFQHPKRTASSWDASLDRFSFISLDLAILALSLYPDLWSRTLSDGDSTIFRANDFADPDHSKIFIDLFSRIDLREDTKNFAAICKSSFKKIPTIDDFIAKRNIPQVSISIASSSEHAVTQYLSAFPVLDATNYDLCLDFVGEKVELIGKIFDVKRNQTRHSKPYVFINFGHWKGRIVKINIWSEGLNALTTIPTESWVGRWVSVTGLMEPPYVGRRKYQYSHLSISITQSSQLLLISEDEAKFRLGDSSIRSTKSGAITSNQKILEDLMKDSSSSQTISSNNTTNQNSRTSNTARSTFNQAVLQNMRSSQPARPPATASQKASSYQGTSRSQPSSPSSNCFIATTVYGADAPETNTLRLWRDKALMTNFFGRVLVSTYYNISPHFVPLVNRNKWIRGGVKLVLDKVVYSVASTLNKK